MKHLFPIVSLCGAIVLAGCGSSSSSSDSDTPTNAVPTIAGDANTTVSVGQPYSFIPAVGDADGDTLTFSIQNKPTWADFNTSNGALTGTPTAYGATADINISVSDGEGTASLPLFTLNVYQRVKQTGQTKSYDDTGEVTDGSVKDDGYYQAGVAIDTERDDELEVVTDHYTGLIWEDDSNVSVSTSLKIDGVVDLDAVCAARSTGGYSDWRFPSLYELLAFTNFSTSLYYDKQVTNIASFLVSDTYAGETFAWGLSQSGIYRKSLTFGSVRCVRGDGLDMATTTLTRDDETEIVTDTKTGLMWQDTEDNSTMNWYAAIDHCEASELGGYDDWRLPNFLEMASVTDFDAGTIKTGFVNRNGFDYYWSSTTSITGNSVYDYRAFYYIFNYDGSNRRYSDYAYSKTEGSFKVTCVRTIE